MRGPSLTAEVRTERDEHLDPRNDRAGRRDRSDASPRFLDGDLSALVLLVPFAGLAGIGLAIGAFQRRRVLRAIPAHVTVSHHGIRFDDTDLPYAQLTRIWLTPAGYPVRRIRFERAAGRTTVHVLGSPRVQMSPEYTSFLLAVRADGSSPRAGASRPRMRGQTKRCRRRAAPPFRLASIIG